MQDSNSTNSVCSVLCKTTIKKFCKEKSVGDEWSSLSVALMTNMALRIHAETRLVQIQFFSDLNDDFYEVKS